MAKFVPIELTKEKIAELDEEHDDVLVVRGDPDMSPWVVVVRRPTRAEIKMTKSVAKRDEGASNEQLIRSVRVFPEPDAFEAQLNRWGFMCDAISNDASFQKFVGLSTAASLK